MIVEVSEEGGHGEGASCGIKEEGEDEGLMNVDDDAQSTDLVGGFRGR